MKIIRNQTKQVTILAITILALFILCGSACGAESSDNQTSVTDASSLDVPQNQSQNNVADPIISGTVVDCQNQTPFEGVTIKVNSLNGTELASTVTNENGYYSVAFLSSEKVFDVSASYPGHVNFTQQVNVTPNPNDPSDPNFYGTANFQMGTLTLTKGSWDVIGLDSNNVNVGPDHFMVQIHVTNNAAVTAQNVVATFAFTDPSPNIYIILDPSESATKNMGNIAPGATVDVFYLINVIRNSNAYDTTSNYTISVAGTNTGSPVDTVSGTLVVKKLLSQNRNTVTSIVVSPTNPTLGSTFAVTVTSSTSSATLSPVDLSLIAYDPSKIQPVSVTITYGSSSSNSILLINPGATSFVSVWTFLAIGPGPSPLSALILDQSGNSYHYNVDFNSTHVDLNVTPKADLGIIKTVNNNTPSFGQQVTFTLTATNYGPNDAHLVVVNDLLPIPALIWVSDTSLGTYDHTTGIWTIGNLTVGSSVSINITAIVNSTGQIINTANITGNETDPNPNNNRDTVSLNGSAVADLVISKSVNNPNPYVGDQVTFTITLTNNGPNDAENVTVTDSLDPGLILVSATPSTGSFNPITGIWSIGTLFHGGIATMTIVATVNQTGILYNNVTATSTTFDPTTPNNATSTVNAQPSADLGVVKTADNTSPNVGNNVTFTITVTNYGPNNATGVNAYDLLPAGLTYVSDTSGGTYNSTSGIWNINNLASGSSVSINITATVNSIGLIVNVVTVNGTEHDPNPLNNQDVVDLNGQPAADLSVTKTVDNPTPNVGDQVTFTITVFNAGPDDATGVVSHDTLPPTGLSYVSSNPSVGTYNPGTGIWAIGSLIHGTSAVMTLVVQVTQTGFLTNIVNVSATQFDPHPEDNTAAVTVNAQPSADLAVVKTVTNTAPNVGQTVTFTIVVTNNGPNNATGVVMTDDMSSGLSIISATPSQGTFIGGIWNIGNLTNGTSVTLTIVANVTQTGTLNNSVTVTGNQHDPNLSNNQDLVILNGQPSADLQVLKSVSNSNPNVGEQITYTVTVYNAGPNDAPNTNLSDVLPPEVALVSATPSVGNYNSGTGLWTIGTLLHGTSASLLLVVNVLQPGLITNFANATSSVFDPHPGDNNASVTITANPSADLAVIKTVDNPTPNLGEWIIFTITATNNGPQDATGVLVSDLLPTGLIFNSASTLTGSYNPGSGIWNIGNLANGTTVTLTINATVNRTNTTFTNVATISGNEFDPDLTNNQDIVILNSNLAADVGVSKTVNNPTPYNGDQITYTISVTNAGPDTATNVIVDDLLPNGIIYISSIATQGTYDPITGIWNIGTLANGTGATLTINATVNKTGIINNTATATANQFDPHPGDNTDTVTIEVLPSADLSITKTPGISSVPQYQPLTFTITVINHGPDNAANVVVNDVLPSGLEWLSDTGGGAYDHTTGIWTIGPLASGTNATLNITVNVTISGQQLTNRVNVTSTTHDPNPTNNQDTAIVNGNPTAELSIAKTVDTPSAYVGQIVTFTVTVTNNGPSDATNVIVDDAWPTGLNILSTSQPIASIGPNLYRWIIGNLAHDASTVLTIVANVTDVGTWTNHVNVTGNEFDPTIPDEANATVVAAASADLAVTKTVDNPTPDLGDWVIFTITAKNNGPSPATFVNVTDILPAGLTFNSASSPNYNNSTGIWNIGAMISGATATLTINATVNVVSQTITNIANITGNEFDPDLSNNQAIATLNGNPAADLAISKTVNNQAPYVGNPVIFTIHVTNAGPDDATGVVVTDTWPSGLTILSTSDPTHFTQIGPNTYQWTVGDLAHNAGATLTITANVTEEGSFTNVATVSGDQFDPHHEDNTSSIGITAEPVANVVIRKEVSNNTPNYLDNITYTITVHNNGPSTATGVIVSDPLPSGLQILSVTPSPGTSYNSIAQQWNVGTLLNGASATLEFLVKVIQTGQMTNLATITHQDQFNPDTTNSSANQTINVPPAADLSITKTVSNPQPYIHEVITFTLIVQNHGPDTATGVYVVDQLPAGVKYVGSKANYGSYDPDTGIWTIGDLPAGAVAQLDIQVSVEKYGPLENHAHVYSNTYDPIINNQEASVTVNVQSPVEVSAKTIGMQKTGAPIGILVLALLMVLSGWTLGRKGKL